MPDLIRETKLRWPLPFTQAESHAWVDIIFMCREIKEKLIIEVLSPKFVVQSSYFGLRTSQ